MPKCLWLMRSAHVAALFSSKWSASFWQNNAIEKQAEASQ